MKNKGKLAKTLLKKKNSHFLETIHHHLQLLKPQKQFVAGDHSEHFIIYTDPQYEEHGHSTFQTRN